MLLGIMVSLVKAHRSAEPDSPLSVRWVEDTELAMIRHSTVGLVRRVEGHSDRRTHPEPEELALLVRHVRDTTVVTTMCCVVLNAPQQVVAVHQQ